GEAMDWGAGVMIEGDDEIIKPIAPPKLLGARPIGMAHPPIVVAVPDGIAPAVAWLKRAHRKPGAWPRQSIGAIEDFAQTPASDRGGTVALALARTAAPRSKRAGHRHAPAVTQPSGGCRRSCQDTH